MRLNTGKRHKGVMKNISLAMVMFMVMGLFAPAAYADLNLGSDANDVYTTVNTDDGDAGAFIVRNRTIDQITTFSTAETITTINAFSSTGTTPLSSLTISNSRASISSIVNVGITGNSDSSANSNEGVYLGARGDETGGIVHVRGDGVWIEQRQTSAGGGAGADAYIHILDSGVFIKGAISNSTGNVTINDALDVTGLITGNNGLNITAGGAAITGATTINTTGGLATTLGNAGSAVSLLGGTNTIGNAGTSANTMTGATNAITATGANTMTGASNAMTATTGANAITGQTGNTMIATTGNNAITATAGSNTMSANAANQSNTISATGAGGVNNITAPTNNIGVSSAFATANNIGTNPAFASTNTIGNTNAGATVTALAGNSTLSVVNNASSLRTVGAVGTSNLTGATAGTTGGTTVVMKGSITGTPQAVVNSNGLITMTTASATQSTAALTLTNGLGNTHGVVVTETQTTMSGGTNSSSLTLNNNGATFSNSQTGAPVTVTGVADGKNDFDAVNYRQIKDAYAGIAAISALTAIPSPAAGKKFSVGMGYGYFKEQSALAIGIKAAVMQNLVLTGGLASGFRSDNITVNAGVGYSW